MIQPERIELLNSRDTRAGRYVLYWMQASQRARCNHALEYAAREANRLNRPLVVGFGLTDDYPEANERHYAFMLEGLAQTQAALRERGIQLVVLRRSPELAAVELSEDASLVVTDRGYLRHQRRWRVHVARAARCQVVRVESDVVVPADVASDKEEFAARTIRPRIHRQLTKYLVPLRTTRLKRDSLGLRFRGFDITDTDAALRRLKIDRSVPRVRDFRGGPDEAEKLLTAFLRRKLARYAEDRNEPSLDGVSHMSPYLHFGQISPLEIALRVRGVPVTDAPQAAKDAYLEELIVRRELSINFVLHNAHYDTYACLPNWARLTLRRHARDPRARTYSPSELEAGRTADPYWNAAQLEMVRTGKMHNYLRMYWGKKILEWSETPEQAFATALRLNNKYHLDGRDPNSFAGVAWCFGKHDRPWGERPVFGTVRTMTAAGLERKCDIEAYVRKIESLG